MIYFGVMACTSHIPVHIVSAQSGALVTHDRDRTSSPQCSAPLLPLSTAARVSGNLTDVQGSVRCCCIGDAHVPVLSWRSVTCVRTLSPPQQALLKAFALPRVRFSRAPHTGFCRSKSLPRQFLHSPKRPRMPIHLRLNVFELHLFQIQC